MPQVPVEGTRAGDGVLTIGTILPQTGSLAFLGPPEFAGFDLAIKEINAAGGVLGKPTSSGIKGDSGDTTTDTGQPDRRPPALAERRRHHRRRLLGRVADGHRQDHRRRRRRMFSPANTSKTLSTYADKGLYFRTAPPDIHQGDVLGQFVIADDGNETVAIIARTTPTAPAWPTTLQPRPSTEAGGEVVVPEDLRPEGARPSTARSTRSSPPTRTPSSSSASTSRRRSSRRWSRRASARRTRTSTAPTATSATPSARLRRRQVTVDTEAEPGHGRSPPGPKHRGAARGVRQSAASAVPPSGRAPSRHGRQRRPTARARERRLSRLGQRAEVELDHLRVGEQLAARAGVGVAALVEHVAAVAHLQAAAGVLLDHQDRHAGVVDLLAAAGTPRPAASATGRPTARRAAAPSGRASAPGPSPPSGARRPTASRPAGRPARRAAGTGR